MRSVALTRFTRQAEDLGNRATHELNVLAVDQAWVLRSAFPHKPDLKLEASRVNTDNTPQLSPIYSTANHKSAAERTPAASHDPLTTLNYIGLA